MHSCPWRTHVWCEAWWGRGMKAPSSKGVCRIKDACHCPIPLRARNQRWTMVGTQMGKSWGGHTHAAQVTMLAWSSAAQCPVSDESHPNQCVCAILVTQSHTKSHQPVGAIELSGCPPRPGPSPQRTLWAQILGRLKATGQPYTWSRGLESALRGIKQGMGSHRSLSKDWSCHLCLTSGLLWLNEPYWKEIR